MAKTKPFHTEFQFQVQFRPKHWTIIEKFTKQKDAMHYRHNWEGGKYEVRIVKVAKTIVYTE